MQKFQDWFTQQWIIVWGQKIIPSQNPWLIGPFGEVNGIGESFIYQLAKNENLTIIRNPNSRGLLNSFADLKLSESDLRKISKNIIDFYEATNTYTLKFSVKWNPFFKVFGYMVNRLFSQRIDQLNIPIKNDLTDENLTNEIIHLVSKKTREIKHVIWLRKYESTGKVIYSGIYSTCVIPSGETCVKAVFPLPNGNATVILKPLVGKNDEFILASKGKKFGDAGFYFLLKDSKGNTYSQYHKSFTDSLVITDQNDQLKVNQILKLWNLKVVNFQYSIHKKIE